MYAYVTVAYYDYTYRVANKLADSITKSKTAALLEQAGKNNNIEGLENAAATCYQGIPFLPSADLRPLDPLKEDFSITVMKATQVIVEEQHILGL